MDPYQNLVLQVTCKHYLWIGNVWHSRIKQENVSIVETTSSVSAHCIGSILRQNVIKITTK